MNGRRKPNMAPCQTPMAEQPMPERLFNFDEVALGYTPEQAMAEAERCLNCPDRYCSAHCPAHSYIPEFIAEVRAGRFEAAWELLRRTNPMMEISGRVCPCERQCESRCTRGIKSEPVAIGRLERFVGDWHRTHSASNPPMPQSKGKRIAVVGAGPAGLTCALSLAVAGFDVTIYEKSQRLGGIPIWGIPAFVLPGNLMEYQIRQLRELGVPFHTGAALGSDFTVEQLRAAYDAVFVATGAERPVSPAAEGLDLPGVVQAKDYLTESGRYPGKTVLVFGGGNTAIDVARTALRQGADSVRLAYRRTQADMPCTQEEWRIAQTEGVELIPLVAPDRMIATSGRLAGVECSQMELAPPDYPGGRNNVRPSGQHIVLECDLAVLALGFENIPVPSLPCDNAGRIMVGRDLATNVDGVYAGGDAVTGPATLMKAVAAGKDAAAAIFARLAETF